MNPKMDMLENSQDTTDALRDSNTGENFLLAMYDQFFTQKQSIGLKF